MAWHKFPDEKPIKSGYYYVYLTDHDGTKFVDVDYFCKRLNNWNIYIGVESWGDIPMLFPPDLLPEKKEENDDDEDFDDDSEFRLTSPRGYIVIGDDKMYMSEGIIIEQLEKRGDTWNFYGLTYKKKEVNNDD